MHSVLFALAMISWHQNYTFVKADVQKAAQVVDQQIPFGRTIGANSDGKCVVIYGSMPDVDPEQIDYARAQVLNGFDEATSTYKSIVGAEVLVGGREGTVKAARSGSAVKIVSGEESIMVEADATNSKNVVVTVAKSGKALRCSIPKTQPN